jgi:predicted ester cyclase
MPDARERERRRSLVRAHVAAENAHDLAAIMATFAEHAISDVNGDVRTTPAQIAELHAGFGMAQTAGMFSQLQVIHEREHFTDEEIVYEGHFHGIHTGTMPGMPPPSGRAIDLPYIVIYRFDVHGKLISERARVELSPVMRALTQGTP